MSEETVAISVRDKELSLRRAQKGDPDALNVLFESCRRRLFSYALRILRKPQDAEDAVQEAMLAAFEHLDQFQGRADFLTWATRIVINAALGQIRRARSRPAVSWGQVDGEGEESLLSESIEDPKPNPEEIYQRVERRRLLEEALKYLPAQNRRAIQLCKLDDWPVKDAAGALGVPLSTLKARLHRGRRSLLLSVKSKTQLRRRVYRGRRSLQPCPVTQQSLRAA